MGDGFRDVRGAGFRAPLAGAAFAAGACSLVGVPLLGGFAVKFYLADAALLGSWQLVVALGALAASSLLNALYYVPVIVNIWSKNLHGDPDPLPGLRRKPVHAPFVVSTLCLSLGAVALGIFLQPVADLLALGLSLM